MPVIFSVLTGPRMVNCKGESHYHTVVLNCACMHNACMHAHNACPPLLDVTYVYHYEARCACARHYTAYNIRSSSRFGYRSSITGSQPSSYYTEIIVVRPLRNVRFDLEIHWQEAVYLAIKRLKLELGDLCEQHSHGTNYKHEHLLLG